MSSVFSSTKVVNVSSTKPVEPEVVDNHELAYELEKKRKKKMGAVSQLLSKENGYEGKDVLGG